jgi:hypothetical protein
MATQEWEHKIIPMGGWDDPKVLDGGTLEAEEAGGWELVSAVPRMQGENQCVWLIFKRPKPKEAVDMSPLWQSELDAQQAEPDPQVVAACDHPQRRNGVCQSCGAEVGHLGGPRPS